MIVSPAVVAVLLAAAAAPPAQLRWLVTDVAAPSEAALVALDARGRVVPPPPDTRLLVDGRELAPTRARVRWELALPRDARELVAVAAGLPEARLELPRAPEGRSVGLAVEPATPVKGRDVEAVVRLEVRGRDGALEPAARPPLLVASGGTISAVRPEAPGRFSATWRLPERRAPEVAVLVAFVPWPHDDAPSGAIGALRVPLATAIELPGHADRANVEVTARIGGASFGPVRTAADRRFLLPVVVPPGASRASGETLDATGLRQSFPIELGLPEMPRLACVAAPARRVSGGREPLRLACAASEPDGRPAERAALRVRAEAGVARPLVALGGGLFELTLAPEDPLRGAPRLVVEFPAAGPASRVVLERPLAPGAPVRLEATRPPTPALAGEVVEVALVATDATGAPVEGARVRRVDAASGELRADREGRASLAVPAGAAAGLRSFRFEARAAGAGAPARLRLRRDGAALIAAVSDAEGRPVEGVALDGGGVTDADGLARRPLGPAGEGLVVHEVRLARNPLVGGRLFELPLADGTIERWGGGEGVPPARAELALDVLSRAVELELTVTGREVRWGARGDAARLEIELSGGSWRERTPGPGPGRGVVEPGPSGASLLLRDPASGVAAFATVPP